MQQVPKPTTGSQPSETIEVETLFKEFMSKKESISRIAKDSVIEEMTTEIKNLREGSRKENYFIARI